MGIIEWAVYGVTVAFVVMVVWVYVRKANKHSSATLAKVEVAKEIGTFEPISLYPHINLSACMGSGACITACPEKDVIGIVDGKATIINATSCIGHSACFLACPVDAITLRIGTAERGVELPHVMPNYESNVPGIFIAGELGGIHFLALVVLIAGWSILLVATFNALDTFGIIITAALLGAIVWVFIDLNAPSGLPSCGTMRPVAFLVL